MKEKYYQDRSKTTKHIGNIDEILTIKYIGTDYSYKHQIVWRNVVGFILLHAFALWGLVLIFTGIALWKTSVWGLCILYIGSEGVTIGAHRCYAHRSFKATPLLRAVMVITQTLAGQVLQNLVPDIGNIIPSLGPSALLRNLQAVESWFVSFLSLGEGWHNYHHAFPWDYKAAELSMHFNLSASIIRFFERIGLAYHLKSASAHIVASRIKRTGDGTHHKMGTEEARTAVTAWGPLHPLNPTYTTTLKTPDAILKPEEPSLYQ